MPKMVLQRNFRLSTNLGHSVGFVKGVPVNVPKEIVDEAMKIGAEFVTEADKESALPKEAEATFIPEGDARETAIFNAFVMLEERNERGDFSASGAPNVGPIASITKFKVDAKERDKLWAEYQVRKAEAAQQ